MARSILAEHRPTLIRDAREGQVIKVVGRIRAGEEVLSSPLTARSGVYYDVLVTAPKPDVGQALRIHERRAVDFHIEDESGRALVRTADMQVAIVRDLDYAVGLFVDQRLRDLLDGYGTHRRLSMRAKEGTLELDEMVAVVGEASWVPLDVGAVPVTYRERPEILVLSTPEAHPLIVSDDPETFA